MSFEQTRQTSATEPPRGKWERRSPFPSRLGLPNGLPHLCGGLFYLVDFFTPNNPPHRTEPSAGTWAPRPTICPSRAPSRPRRSSRAARASCRSRSRSAARPRRATRRRTRRSSPTRTRFEFFSLLRGALGPLLVVGHTSRPSRTRRSPRAPRHLYRCSSRAATRSTPSIVGPRPVTRKLLLHACPMEDVLFTVGSRRKKTC